MTEHDRKWEWEEWLENHPFAMPDKKDLWEQLERWYAWGVADERARIKAALEAGE